jgi:hypothetical protein
MEYSTAEHMMVDVTRYWCCRLQMRFRDRLQYLSVDKMITIKMDYTEIESEYVSWIHVAQDRFLWTYGNGASGFMNVRNFLIC